MIRRVHVTFALAMWLLVRAAPSEAQTVGATTGALNGRVTDPSGAVLPGVTVVASGTALILPRPAVTDARGRYEFPAVPPGEYTLVFSMPAFSQVSRQNIRVTLGATTTVDQVLDLAARQETIVVAGQSPLLDRSGTTIGTSLDARLLADLPAARSSGAIIDATPGIQLTRFDVGGSAGSGGGPFNAYGQFGLNRPTIEGIAITGYNPFGFTLDYGSFDAVSVNLGAHGPEWPWPGVAVNIVTKSGGDRPGGSVYVDYEHRHWQAFNIDADQILRGARSSAAVRAEETNRLWSYRDVNVDAGGPLRKDRLWGYVSLRNQETSTRQISFPVKPVITRITNLGGKASAQSSVNSRVVAFGQATRNHQPTRLDGFLRPGATVNQFEDSTSNQIARGVVWKGEWNAVVTKKVYFESRVGQFIASRHERPNGASPRREDVSGEVFGGNRDWDLTQRDVQLVASASYQTTGRTGSHNVSVGGEIRRRAVTERWFESYADGVLHVTDRSRPQEVYLFQTPSRSVDGMQWYGAHLQDSWRAGSRFTFNLGLRFDRYRLFYPAQEHPAGQSGSRSWSGQTFAAVNNLIDWNVLAPRVSVSHVLTDDNRTVLKLTYGAYSLPPGTFQANPNPREWWDLFQWRDHDGDTLWDPSEETQLLDRMGGAVESVDPDLKLPTTREATARLEREIVPNLVTIETHVVWRGVRNPFVRHNRTEPFSVFTRTVTVIDPGIDGISGTGDDGQLTVYDLPEAAPPPSYVVGNVLDARTSHLAWEVTAQRRFSRRWSFVAGFSHTWAREHASGYFGQPVRANAYPLTPNDLINTDDGGRDAFRVWSARAYGTFEGPWRLRFTPFLRHQSGQPYGRTFQVSSSVLNLGSLRVLAEPIGTRRMDNVTLFDIRVQKTFAPRANVRLAAFVDVFNVLNANPEQNMNWSSVGFGRPLAIVPPRIARLGVKLDW
jgi:hypothetical protein